MPQPTSLSQELPLQTPDPSRAAQNLTSPGALQTPRAFLRVLRVTEPFLRDALYSLDPHVAPLGKTQL